MDASVRPDPRFVKRQTARTAPLVLCYASLMTNRQVINAVRNPASNLTKLSKASGVSIRTLMDLRHNPLANPTMHTLDALAKAIKSGAI